MVAAMQTLGRNVAVLKKCGTDEDLIDEAITNAQRAVFQQLKIDPDKGNVAVVLVVFLFVQKKTRCAFGRHAQLETSGARLQD